jgi:hypothetical protein
MTLWSETVPNNWGNGTTLYIDEESCLERNCFGVPNFFKCNDTDTCYEIDPNNCQVTSTSACASDVRLKDEIVTIELALETLLQLEPLEYDWDETYSNYQQYKKLGKLHSLGFIAQDVKKLIPEAVTISTGGYYHVEYPALNAYLVEAIKEQQVFIDDISEILSDLENKVESYNG